MNNAQPLSFCPQVGAVYRLLIDLKICVVLLIAICSVGSVAAQAPNTATTDDVKVIATKLSGFGVPFKIDSENSAYIEVQLYLSRDAGKTWTFYARQDTDGKEFPFQAEEDGEYWFSLKTLSRDRLLLPEGDPQPELKILIDTVTPKLDVRIQADPAGRVICRWQATDQNLSPQSIKLLYQPVLTDGSAQQWQKVPVNLGGVARNGVYSDQVGWWPETTEATVNVAIEIMDRAGNTVREARKVNLPATAWRTRSASTALPNSISDSRNQTTLKPTTNGAGANGLPQQPDWAYPGWKSRKELRLKKGNLPIGPKTLTNPAVPDKTADHDNHKPSGVVCENGVCRLPTEQAATSQLDNRHQPPSLPQQPGITSGQLASNPVSTNPSTTNPVSNRTASTDSALLPLIGSPEEYVAPPTPAGYVARPQPPITQQQPIAQQPLRRTSQAIRTSQAVTQHPPTSIPWQSEKDNWQPKGRLQSSESSSVRKFDATITPLPTRQSPVPPPATHLPSNPSKMFFEGNQVIGQSSTLGSNQYQGQRSTVNSVPSPKLLPKVETNSQVVASENRFPANRFPQTDQAPFQEAPQLGSMQRLPPKNFTSAGFNRPESPIKPREAKRSFETGSRDSVSGGPIAGGSTSSGEIAKPNRSTRAPVQIIGSNRFRLNYGIDSIDPSGVGKVVLWMTRDDGQTWKTWGTDPDRRSPFPVEVTEQGRYGFRIVVQSKDGLTGQGPSSGDDADIWIVVDTTSPLAQITSVPYGRAAEAGKLCLLYTSPSPRDQRGSRMPSSA